MLSQGVQLKDIVFIQRSNDNSSYGEVHISGSKLVIYIDIDGNINADTAANFYSVFPPPAPTGASGNFLSADAKTITVVNGIITNIV